MCYRILISIVLYYFLEQDGNVECEEVQIRRSKRVAGPQR